jgi:hypothetical protein
MEALVNASLAALLANDIETYATRLRTNHPLLVTAQCGELGPATVVSYLMNVRFMVAHTPLHLRAARERCLGLGQHELAEFFACKLNEEIGHDQWSEQDLTRLERVFAAAPAAQPSRHLRDLVHFLDRVISERPANYLSYTLFAQYLSLLIGPVWVSASSEHPQLPLHTLSAVSEHVELETGHIADELRQIDALLRGEKPLPHLDVLHRAMRLFERFCDALFETHAASRSAAPAAAE